MYQVFDKFLAVETWHTTHPLDSERFYRALDQVVREENFNADTMARYMREKIGVSSDDESYFAAAIRRYSRDAWAVRDYLTAVKAI